MRHFLLLLALAMACAGARATAADSAAQAEAPRIAVLRLQDTLLAFKMYADGMVKLKQEHAERKAKLQAIEERMTKIEETLPILNKDSDAYAKAALEFKSLEVEDHMSADRGTQVLEGKRATLDKESFAAIRAILRSFCQDHGIKLVHLAPNADFQGTDNREIEQALMSQTVLYFDPALDITDAFIPYLNEHWAAQAAKADATTPAPPKPQDAQPPAPTH